MAKAAAPKHPVKTFYLYDPNVFDVLGKPIDEKDGERTVRMTDVEAQYYIDQGAVGVKPWSEIKAKALPAAEQMIGTGVKDQEAFNPEPAPPPKGKGQGKGGSGFQPSQMGE